MNIVLKGEDCSLLYCNILKMKNINPQMLFYLKFYFKKNSIGSNTKFVIKYIWFFSQFTFIDALVLNFGCK